MAGGGFKAEGKEVRVVKGKCERLYLDAAANENREIKRPILSKLL